MRTNDFIHSIDAIVNRNIFENISIYVDGELLAEAKPLRSSRYAKRMANRARRKFEKVKGRDKADKLGKELGGRTASAKTKSIKGKREADLGGKPKPQRSGKFRGKLSVKPKFAAKLAGLIANNVKWDGEELQVDGGETVLEDKVSFLDALNECIIIYDSTEMLMEDDEEELTNLEPPYYYNLKSGDDVEIKLLIDNDRISYKWIKPDKVRSDARTAYMNFDKVIAADSKEEAMKMARGYMRKAVNAVIRGIRQDVSKYSGKEGRGDIGEIIQKAMALKAGFDLKMDLASLDDNTKKVLGKTLGAMEYKVIDKTSLQVEVDNIGNGWDTVETEDEKGRANIKIYPNLLDIGGYIRVYPRGNSAVVGVFDQDNSEVKPLEEFRFEDLLSVIPRTIAGLEREYLSSIAHGAKPEKVVDDSDEVSDAEADVDDNSAVIKNTLESGRVNSLVNTIIKRYQSSGTDDPKRLFRSVKMSTQNFLEKAFPGNASVDDIRIIIKAMSERAMAVLDEDAYQVFESGLQAAFDQLVDNKKLSKQIVSESVGINLTKQQFKAILDSISEYSPEEIAEYL